MLFARSKSRALLSISILRAKPSLSIEGLIPFNFLLALPASENILLHFFIIYKIITGCHIIVHYQSGDDASCFNMMDYRAAGSIGILHSA
jgi:hypothetical protein